MFKIKFEKRAEDFFNKLDNSSKIIVGKKIEKLKQNPELGKPLTANLAGLWSLRIEKYRAIYQIKKEELIIFILKLGHRKGVYES